MTDSIHCKHNTLVHSEDHTFSGMHASVRACLYVDVGTGVLPLGQTLSREKITSFITPIGTML